MKSSNKYSIETFSNISTADAVLRIERLSENLSKDPESEERAEWLISRAHLMNVTRQNKCSLEDYHRALDSAKDSEQISHIKSMIALQTARDGPMLEALVWACSAVEEAPNSPEARHCLGLVYGVCEMYTLATEAHERAVAMDPEYLSAIRCLGSSLRQVCRVPESIAILLRYVEAEPHDPYGLFELGRSVQLDFDNPHAREEAIKYFQKALLENPDEFLQRSILTRLDEFKNLGYVVE